MPDFLVTGGLGFQGSHLTKALLDSGATVRILARFNDHTKANQERILDSQKLDVFWGDLSNFETVRACVRGSGAVVHLAAQINVDESLTFPERSLTNNIVGTFNVLEAARISGKVPVIIGSSCEVYGTNFFPGQLMNELHPLNPRSPYAATKAGADRLAFSYFTSYDLPILVARCGNVYGYGQKSRATGALIARWMDRAIKGEKLSLYGDGRQGRDFIHISDVVKAYMALIASIGSGKNIGEAFNFGTGVNTPVADIARIIVDLSGASVEYGKSRAGEVANFALDSSKAFELLGWQPSISIEEGLKITYEEALERGGF